MTLVFQKVFGIAFSLMIHDENKMIRRNIIVTLYAFFFVNITIHKFKDQAFKKFALFQFYTNPLRTDNETKSVKLIHN